jgi:hypothetical protein
MQLLLKYNILLFFNFLKPLVVLKFSNLRACAPSGRARKKKEGKT